MIALVTGKIRSGKTIYCVGKIVEHIAKGGYCFTNIHFYRDKLEALIRKRYRVHMLPEQLVSIDLTESDAWHDQIAWGTRGCPVLVVLDEIHLFFNSRAWAKTQRDHPQMLSFLSQSGKAAVDVLFIAQVANTLEKQFRVQSEVEFYCRKVGNVRVPLLPFRLPINRLLVVEKDNADDPGKTQVQGARFIRYDKALFDVYETLAFLDKQMREASEKVRHLERLKLQRVSRLHGLPWGRAHKVAVACVVALFWWHLRA